MYEMPSLHGGSRVKKTDFYNLELATIHARAKKIFDNERIETSDFIAPDKYMESEVEADDDEVKRLEAKFLENKDLEQERIKQLSDILEAIIYDQTGKRGWVGDKTIPALASKPDDYKRGVDMFFEFPADSDEETEGLVLGIDVTFSNDVNKKLTDIRDRIDSGKLTDVKYFKSQDGDEELKESDGKRSIPRVLIAVEEETARRLAQAWMEVKPQDFKEHPLQIQIRDEIAFQLTAFKEYALAKDKGDLAEVYRKAEEVINKIREQKRPKTNKEIVNQARAQKEAQNKIGIAIPDTMQAELKTKVVDNVFKV